MSVRLIQSLESVRSLPQITLGSIIVHIEGEALLLLCLISIIPFLQPIPIPGLSTILGMIVLLQGIGLMFWSKPLLTQRLKKFSIAHDKFEKIYLAAKKFSSFTSKISVFKHPITNTRLSHFFCGFSIILSAIFLSLPLPIPLSNLVPAVSIFLICIGLLEDDVVLVLGGIGMTIAVIWMGTVFYQLISEWIRNLV